MFIMLSGSNVVGLLLVLTASFLITETNGGTCWFAVGNNGRCRGYEKTGVTYEECCGDVFQNKGWTPGNNPNNGQLFIWLALAGGAPQCQSCLRSCDRVHCSKDRRCKMRHGRPRCVCDPDCSKLASRHHGPICGTDRHTYKNHCSLIKHNCRHNDNVEIDFYGQCQGSCTTVQCDNGKFCVQDQHGLPHCVHCQTDCPPVYDMTDAICGSDSITYNSLCEFQRAACMSGSKPVGLAYLGPCSDTLTCEDMVCLHSKNCLRDVVTNQPRCVTCHGYCQDIEGSPPICGTDGNTYYSYCEMKRLSCSSGTFIDTVHSGPCHW
ncbi:hypothetical protein LSH36_300g02015 [Paralvinella palmiformis]|uniref:Follistatin n=1 Tax=Paralvinella palmiformis TaxID=53620 RepID=A0AAD9JJG8_9ANNE|nr:hypothetical protein LSH36_300g02015 [Paralvinella palmiformis]